ncbi:MAG: MTH1187 family thiamine-binding protein [Gemmatimonadota bacterium]
MRATAEVQVIPIGVGVSVRKEVQRAHRILEESGLTVELHGNGTNMEGELSDILAAVQKVHETLHAEGAPRLSTFLKLGTRTDKEPSLSGKLF